MTFEEDFPSLKYKYYLEVGTYNPLFQCVEINEIQEHCLEKQKVKEIIERTWNLVIPKHFQNDYRGLKIALLNQLKLEE
jgi:hypothetical protein